jgi:hypothetical protein
MLAVVGWFVASRPFFVFFPSYLSLALKNTGWSFFVVDASTFVLILLISNFCPCFFC